MTWYIPFHYQFAHQHYSCSAATSAHLTAHIKYQGKLKE